jgi:peptidoglycan hydrolase FlgJ
MPSLLPVALPPAATARLSPSPRLVRAAQQFEALLLETLLAPLEKTFASIPGGESLSSADSYQSLGAETLATGLSHSGGLGIAAMIIRNFLKNKAVTTSEGMAAGAKAYPLPRR